MEKDYTAEEIAYEYEKSGDLKILDGIGRDEAVYHMACEVSRLKKENMRIDSHPKLEYATTRPQVFSLEDLLPFRQKRANCSNQDIWDSIVLAIIQLKTRVAELEKPKFNIGDVVWYTRPNTRSICKTILADNGGSYISALDFKNPGTPGIYLRDDITLNEGSI